MHNSIDVQAASLISPKSCLLSLSPVMGRLCDLGVSKNYFGRQLKFLLRFISLSGGYQGKGKLYTSTKSSSGSERVQDHLGQAYMNIAQLCTLK